MSALDVHDDWLSLIEISGPFLAVPVLKEAFPQGLEGLDGIKKKRLRQAYEEWCEALELEDAQFAELHAAWIEEVLSRGLELDEGRKGDVLKRANWCEVNLKARLHQHGVTLSPDLAVVDEQRTNKPLLLIQTYSENVDLGKTLKLDGWGATPADRMVALCRSLGCRLGLVTNGERWMLVDAPVGAVTTFASWYARIWTQEPITLQAFVHLLGIRRFFVDESEQLPALFDRSLKFQDEVTDALGEQVRRAVEVLIQSLDKADQDRNRELLHDVKEPELYEAALTVMMRLVFLLSAEERGLLLMGDERYEANYALSTLRMQLRKESEEILERRWDAWSRLLAIFRAVFGGIEHENLRLPALGGSLFDPDRFPFLEGRAKVSNWRSDAAKPLPIDNRTVLLLLDAIQQFQGRTLSYRALDVEQIGYVYEGLLERTVKRIVEVTLELDATKSAKTPWVKLTELESARLNGSAHLAELLQVRSGSSASRVSNDLAKAVDDTLSDRLLTACQGDTKLRDRVKPYAHLLRTDPWGYPLVYPTGAFIVTTGSDRRETGTHYTPKSLTEAIVAETLTPVAYIGPSEGKPRDQWVLKSSDELLDLKICDPAMGSGAFLVQTCRWLSDRLVEAWSLVEVTGKTLSVDGEVLEAGFAKELLPRDNEARTVIARRLIAERCLYGVDLNPLAVELAKLSIWLVTLARGRPFGFLDHNLRCGDSLLGIHRLDQLTQLSMNPADQGQLRLFGQNIENAVNEAIELRQRLRRMPIRDIYDVENMARLDGDARRKLEVPESIADAFIGEVFASSGNAVALENAISSLAISAEKAVDGDADAICSILSRTAYSLAIGLNADRSPRKPLHWPLEFPEVFARTQKGFDAVLGNPPFVTGKRISTFLGEKYQAFLKNSFSDSKGAADFCVYFLRRGFSLVKGYGLTGMIATKSIAEGDSRQVGIAWMASNGAHITWALHELPWPGSANVVVSLLVTFKGTWMGESTLNGRSATFINDRLIDGGHEELEEPKPLIENKGNCSDGIKIQGEGFVISQQKKNSLIDASPNYKDVVLPYLTGMDIAQGLGAKPTDWIISFGLMSYAEASNYPLTFQILEDKVKPYRDGLTGQIHEKDFWKFWDKRERFFAAMAGKGKILACPSTSKYLLMTFIEEGWIPSHSVKLFAYCGMPEFSVMQSSVHEVWARQQSGKLGQTLAYNLSKGFATFPWPDNLSDSVSGREFYEKRSLYCAEHQICYTDFYNAFNDAKNSDDGLNYLRYLFTEMDQYVAKSYGWSDLLLEHGFHDVPYLPKNDRRRFTISEHARLEVLRRLSKLNHQRYKEESDKNSKEKSESSSSNTRRESLKKNVPKVIHSDLFDGEDA